MRGLVAPVYSMMPTWAKRALRPVHNTVRHANFVIAVAYMSLRTHDPDLKRRAKAIQALSRSSLGWATTHRTRFWEYGWTLQQVDVFRNGRTLSVADVGAGRSPIPIALSQSGFRTIVADPGSVHSSGVEWSWTDYSSFGVETKRTGMENLSIPSSSLGFVLCISVLEHVPSSVRRAGLTEFARTLEVGGICIITLDLVPGTNRLWNRALGRQVESDSEHGTLPDITNEASEIGLELQSQSVSPLHGVDPRVDVVGLVFRKAAP